MTARALRTDDLMTQRNGLKGLTEPLSDVIDSVGTGLVDVRDDLKGFFIQITGQSL